jgi:hypothetical protein
MPCAWASQSNVLHQEVLNLKQKALICGYTTVFANSVASRLEDMGWNVARVPLSEHCLEAIGELLNKTETPDMFIFFTGKKEDADKGGVRDGPDYDEIVSLYEHNTVLFLRIVEFLHEPMRKSQLKRICLVSHSAASINLNRSTGGYGFSMSLAALNSLMKMLANLMRPEGFTFRLLCADDAESIPDAADNAIAYLLRNRSYDPHSQERHDENRLVLRDLYGRELPF